MKKFTLVLFVLLHAGVCSLLAQNIRVTGTVTDESNAPLAGVTVTIPGTTLGTSTDAAGKYSILAPADGQLQFSFIGMRTALFSVSNRTAIDVRLESDATGIDEVIVVAYGTASKAGYTGSASTVSKDLIARSQVSNVTQLLQGSASGVQVISSSGQPGAEANIYIRGIGSMSAETTPLWVVDGAPLDANSSSLNPADIESINVLKDAAATSLYGSRAANGLVIVTTKKGRQNQSARIDASFRYGVSSRAQQAYNRLGTDQYWELTWETLRNTALDAGNSASEAAVIASRDIVNTLEINPYGPAFPQPVGTDGKIVEGAVPLWNDNWIKAYEKGAKRMEAQVGISGGGAKSSYYVSFSYLDQTGIYPGAAFERFTGRVNLSNELKPWLRLNTSINLTRSTTDNAGDGDSNSGNALFTAMLIPDFYPVYARDLETGEYIRDADGKKIPDYGDGIYSTRTSYASANSNHIGSAKYDFDRSNRDVALIRTSLEVDLYKGLSYIGSANIDYNMLGSHSYANPVYGSSATGSVTKAYARTSAMTFNNLLNYQKSFHEIHNMKLMAGQEYYEYNWSNASASRTGFPALGLDEPSAASTVSDGSGYSQQYKLLSFFGNAEYNFDQKYFLSASIRTDGSSRFYKDNRWGTFWAVGASWRLSEEEFIKQWLALSKLTLRSSYGGQGNDNIGGYYAYMGLYAIYNNLGESGFRTSQLPSYNLKWESQLNFNLGLDIGFWNNRLTATAEFFNRESRDLLFDVPMAYSTGYSSRSQNIGKMRNRGVELQVSGTPIQTTEWLWTIWANATHFKNKITSIPTDVVTTTRLRTKGGSMYDFFLAEWAGVDPETGLAQWYKTVDGKREKTFIYNEASDSDSRIIAGSALPDLNGGFGTEVKWRNLDLALTFNYSIGGKIYDGDKIFIMGTLAGRAKSEELLDRWQNPGDVTNYPRLQSNYEQSWTGASTRWLHNASYMRLKNLSVGYSVPASILERIKIQALRVSFQAENLFTVFGVQGLDPEQSISGVSSYRYPNERTFSFGVNLSF